MENMGNSGWVKIWRCLFDDPIWTTTTAEQKVILVTIIMMANHERKKWVWKGKKYTCEPGEMITSTYKLAKKAGDGITRRRIRTALDIFEKRFEFLTYETSRSSTKIKITNWLKYQGFEGAGTVQSDPRVTQTRPTGDPQVTQMRPQVTTNKNDKECISTIKNDEEEKTIKAPPEDEDDWFPEPPEGEGWS